ncbi:hypothetical protein [Bacillus sp. FJAT-27245]|uniref:hypothetical protein n=1 Tax=Bacillus sp. FJAT-27245 TaxID=1684144 RepID=UPI0006A7BCDD|nr:hypothetical protein [Bacillus sp. FJAT-27245]
MKRFSFFCLVLIFILTGIPANGVQAYSYGDPNEEKVAEVYKQMVVKLNQNPPNYKDALALFATVREEIDMHMGPEPGSIIQENLDKKEKIQAIENMEKLLVLNIARRLESIEKNFEQFDTSKKLLAKGFATYDAISPKVEAKDPATDKKIRDDFNVALESLGNPGLFGVGKKEPNLDEFIKRKDDILSALKEQFEIKNLEVGHFSESASEVESNSGKKDWTDVSNLRNWIPLILIAAVIVGVVIYTARKRKK